MKLKKFLAGTAAVVMAATTMAVSAFAAETGPNGDDNFTVFGIHIPMTKDEAIANGVLDADGKGNDDCPIKVVIDSIKFDGKEVDFVNDSPMLYWENVGNGGVLKYEMINIYNPDINGGPLGSKSVFSEMPSKSIEVTATISGFKSEISGKGEKKGYTALAGGFGTGDGQFSTSFWPENDPKDNNPSGTTPTYCKVTSDGQFTVKITFPDEDGNVDADTSTGEENPQGSKDDAAPTDAKNDNNASTDNNAGTGNDAKSDNNNNTAAAGQNNTNNSGSSNSNADNSNAATGATTGIALAGVALAAIALIASKKRK